MKPLFDQVLEDTASETFSEQFYNVGVPGDVIKIEVTSEFQDDVSDEVTKALDATKAKIE